ncbi:B-cell receptor-associated protein 29-like [Ptychodera flava]|uniref:B-cell receptor-associated protein 29-like n=1 Tax=Ptychodera flava TaxID=63121 RepID=UPI00396A4DDB
MPLHLLFQVVASFLVVEMMLVILLLAPFVRATTWKKVYESTFWMSVRDGINKTLRTELKYKYFLIAIVAIVTVSFIDSGRDVYKIYFPDDEKDIEELKINPCAKHIAEEKYYRESKSFLITGFALYLAIVLHLLRSAIAKRAALEKELEEASAKPSPKSAHVQSEEIEALKKSGIEAKVELKEAKQALSKAEAELGEMKEKYLRMNVDYDELSKNYQKLQEQTNVSEESKKDL